MAGRGERRMRLPNQKNNSMFLYMDDGEVIEWPCIPNLVLVISIKLIGNQHTFGDYRAQIWEGIVEQANYVLDYVGYCDGVIFVERVMRNQHTRRVL